MSTKHDADVIVAGAGPAGADRGACVSRARGVRVLIVERYRAAAAEAMRRRHQHARVLAVSLARRSARPHSDAAGVEPVSRRSLGRSLPHASRGPRSCLIRRIEFDHLLVSLAIEAGAQLLAPAAIAQARAGRRRRDAAHARRRELRAPMVIAADGVNSVIARRLGINPGWPAAKLALDMMEETPVAALRAAEPETLSVFYGYGGAHGYAYIFPKREHVNVGIGYRAAVLSGSSVDVAPYDLQQQFVGDLRARGLMDGESQRGHFTPFLIPIGGPLRRTTADGRVLLAGDAGGFVNGFSAEGIYYAMVTGDLAARRSSTRAGGRVAPARRGRSTCARWRREIGAELRDSVLIQRVPVPQPRPDGPRRPRRQTPAGVLGRLSWITRAGGCRIARRGGGCCGISRVPPRLAWVALGGGPPRLRRERRDRRAEARAVLFDLDDTLFDHRRSARAALARVHRCFRAAAPSTSVRAHHTRFLESTHVEVLARRVEIDEARSERFRRVFRALGLRLA